MAAGNGQHSYGAMVFYAQYGVAAPGVALTSAGNVNWTWLAEVFSANGVPMNPSATKITHLQSDRKSAEKVPGINDGGQLNLKLNYYKALMLIIQTLLADETDTAPDWGRFQWLLQLPDHGQWYFTGFVQGNPVDVPEDDRVVTDMTIEISGRPVFAAL